MSEAESDHLSPSVFRAQARLSVLRDMQDGWRNGMCYAPSRAALTALHALLDAHPILFLGSGIFPRPDGSVAVEGAIGAVRFAIVAAIDGALGAHLDDRPCLVGIDALADMLLDAATPAFRDPETIFWGDGPLVIQMETGFGTLIGCALPEEEPSEWIGVVPHADALPDFMSGASDLRDLHLDPRSRLFTFDWGGPLTPLLGPVPERWIPGAGLTAADVNFSPCLNKEVLP